MGHDLFGAFWLVAIVLRNFSFAILVGALLCGYWLRERVAQQDVGVARQLLVVARLGSVTTAVSTVLIFWGRAMHVSGQAPSDAVAVAVSMVETTRSGQVWLANAALALAASVILLVRHELRRGSALLVLVCVAGTALARSNLSRSVEAGVLSVPVLADCVHLLAVSSWLGIVFVAAFVVLREREDVNASWQSTSMRFIQSLSSGAAVALIALMITGAINGIRLIDTPFALVSTRFGKLLLLKLALVSAAVAMAAYSRFVVKPRLAAHHRQQSLAAMATEMRKFRRVLRLESVALGAALVAAALLVASPAP
jgi:copper resistance protein D